MKKIICTLLIFVFSFTIFSYTLMVRANAENVGSESLIEDIEKDENEEENQVMSSGSSGGTDNNGETWYDLQVINGVPQLPHAVDYSTQEGLIKYLKPGDLIYEDVGGFDITGHTAMVYDILYSEEYQQYYVVVIEAVSLGVCYGLFTPTRFINKESEIYRLTDASDTQIQGAITWAETQLEEAYCLATHKNPNASNNNWYCSELVWAAFYWQGIYLDKDDNREFGTVVLPTEIRDYENATLIMHYQHDTTCVSNADETHTFTCNNEVLTESHAYVSLNSCYAQCKACDCIKQVSSHNYTHNYMSQSSTAHYAYCECGNSILQTHNFTETSTHKSCIECGYSMEINHVHLYTYSSCRDGKNHRKSCNCGISSLELCFGMKQDDGKSYCRKCGQLMGGGLLLSTDDEELTSLMGKFSFYVDLHT